MQVKRTVNKIQKELGIKLTKEIFESGTIQYTGVFGSYTFQFSSKDNYIRTIDLRSTNDHSDPQSDYCAWSFYESLKWFLEAMKSRGGSI